MTVKEQIESEQRLYRRKLDTARHFASQGLYDNAEGCLDEAQQALDRLKVLRKSAKEGK